MHKTKRTLIVSSIVMILVLVVAIVSATAAWFSNYASSKEDGFTIDSTTVTESVSIGIDNTIVGYGREVWPAVSKLGLASKGTEMPFGQTLISTKTDGSPSNDNIAQNAKCAVFYFPMTFVGTGDSWANDNRKSVQVSVASALLAEVGEDEKETLVANSANYLEYFNVQMELVHVEETTTDEGEGASTSNVATPITSHSYKEFNKEGDVNGDFVYFHQPTITNAAKDVSNNLYMLIVPGTKYYVKATVYFNRVDEECPEELLYATKFSRAIQIKFNIQFLQNTDKVDMRAEQLKEPFDVTKEI